MEVWGGNQTVDKAVELAGLDAWVFSRPYQGESAGGDIHYLSSCASGRITRLLVADVSGHGEVVAGTAVKLRDLMRRFVNFLDQSQLVEKMNQEFSALASVSTFATAVVATYWAPTDYLVMSNAGHPPPLFYHAASKRWRYLDRKSQDEAGLANAPMGMEETTRYDLAGITLARDDLVLVYTDSLIEARDPAGKLLGPDGLLEIVGRLDPRDPARFIHALIEAVTAYGGGSLPADDVTALLLKTNEQKPRNSLADGMAATGRLLKAFFGSLKRRGERMAWPEARLENIAGTFIPRLNRRWGPGRKK
jgi:phosphoserine phosphatase RsbU/P